MCVDLYQVISTVTEKLRTPGLRITANNGHGSNKGLFDMNTIDIPALHDTLRLEVQSLTAYCHKVVTAWVGTLSSLIFFFMR